MSRGGDSVTQTELECDDKTRRYRPGSFGSVDYTLTPSVRASGLRQLGLTEEDVAIDLFASEDNAQAPLFCTSENSAMRYSWTALCRQTNKWLWANPPFDCMHELVQKMHREPVNMILLGPYWPRHACFALLERMATNSYFIYRSETEYKQKPGLPTPPPPKWDTVLFRVETLRKGGMVDEKRREELWGLGDLEKSMARPLHEPNPVAPAHPTTSTSTRKEPPSSVQHVTRASHAACALPVPLVHNDIE